MKVTTNVNHRSNSVCENRALPDARIRARIRLRDGNAFKADSRKTFVFCCETCGLQTAFLQLETSSTRDSITRFLAGKAVSFAQFCQLVPLERVDGRSERPEIPLQVLDSVSPKIAKSDFMTPPHAGISGRAGRPRKWISEAERKRALRQRKKQGLILGSSPVLAPMSETEYIEALKAIAHAHPGPLVRLMLLAEGCDWRTQ
jgi:hypothetical protein